MTQTSNDAIDRREALRRAALLLGGALSGPTLAGILAGCDARRANERTWAPRVLTADHVELVAAICDHIIPDTDTPGARAVGVQRFIDAMLAEAYSEEQRRRVAAGLADIDVRARAAWGHPFLQSAVQDQRAVLEQLDREAFSTPDAFFRDLKALTLLGYYTSEVGATRELRHAPIPGRFDGCVPLHEIGRTWAV